MGYVSRTSASKSTSRRHATIEYSEEDKGFVIRDCGSLNGVAVNNIRVSRSRLKDGDVIQLAGAAQVAINKKLKTTDASARYRFKERPSKDNLIDMPAPLPSSKESRPATPAVSSSSAIPSKDTGQLNSVCGVDKSVIQSHLTCALCRYHKFKYSFNQTWSNY